ncbi:26S proteasome regulatory subunit S14 [Tieghemostelium lacteum]|uniref:26S proteasome regulatory subunit S14 n=1 Tax=Tieghemostelium lacteum TaxID=361077 RepID=A0A151Z8E8_TIELA|nr:26S proteasome regulatory subunit S14 [Tieghemostelium lacteum]|eukprot:KYQ90221.1 26S proteasome regulatory subunit S14 [Tieghemostelium lacteum]
MDFDKLANDLNEFKKLVDSQSNPKENKQIQELLGKLKIGSIIHLQSNKDKKNLTLARDIFEAIALYSIHIIDIESFVRYYTQLKIYYFDYKKLLEPSQHEYTIIGLNLMRLLAEHKNSEFHSELEIIPLDRQENPFISFPLSIEKSIAEGSYYKVINSKSDVPSKYYQIFIDILSTALREDIAKCSEKSFKSLSLQSAEKVLLLNSPQQLQQYIQSRQWSVQGDRIQFHNEPLPSNASDIPSLQLINQTLYYAKELERIV